MIADGARRRRPPQLGGAPATTRTTWTHIILQGDVLLPGRQVPISQLQFKNKGFEPYLTRTFRDTWDIKRLSR